MEWVTWIMWVKLINCVRLGRVLKNGPMVKSATALLSYNMTRTSDNVINCLLHVLTQLQCERMTSSVMTAYYPS